MADLLQGIRVLNIRYVRQSYLDVDGGLEGSLLGVVPLQAHAVLVVPYAVCRDRGVMTERVALAIIAQAYHRASVPDLLADELRRACLVLPLAQEQLA